MNDIAQLQQENFELKKKVEEWQNKYYSMLEQFKLAQQRHYGSSSEKNVLQGDFF